MKQFLLPYAAVACATLLFAGSASGAVIISEYVEGSGNNKAVELYNAGPAPVNLSDFLLRIYFNGNPASGSSVSLAGVLPAGATWVIAHASAGFAAIANQTSSALTFNGNDAVVLEHAGAAVDRVGQIGFNPGAEWGSGLVSTADNTLRRLPGVLAGDTGAGTAFDPSLQWLGFAVNTFDGLGVHQVLSIPEPRSWMFLALGMVLLAGTGRFARSRSTG